MLSRRPKPQPGEVVVYRKTKFGDCPGPRAKRVYPTAGGDDYTYHVDKYWVVAGLTGDGVLELKTRTGKTHCVALNDPMLRRLTWWERWVRRRDLPTLAQAQAAERERLQRMEHAEGLAVQSA